MAGSLAIVRTDDLQDPVATISDQWEIQFARFFGYPPDLSFSCPDLRPFRPKSRKRPGTWISSFSSAFLRFVNDHSTSDVILTVSLRGKILVSRPFSIVFASCSPKCYTLFSLSFRVNRGNSKLSCHLKPRSFSLI